MESITEKVLNTALAHLKASGCHYYVIDKDGTAHLHGIDPDQIKSPKRHRGPSKGPRHSWAAYGHVEKIKAMAVGDVLQFHPKEGDDAEGLRKVISSSGNRFFGTNNFATTITDGVIEIMRMG